MQDKREYLICDECYAWIENSDWDNCDIDDAECGRIQASAAAFEEMCLSEAGINAHGDVQDCYVCGECQYGNMHRYTDED